MKKGDLVKETTSGKTVKIDAKVSDSRGDLYRLASLDKWFDDRYLKPA